MSHTLTGAAHGSPAADTFDAPSPALRRWPLLRCLLLYRATPWRFFITLAIYALISGALALQQWLLGRAIHDVQDGRAVVALPGGGLDLGPALLWLGVLSAVAFGRAALQYLAAIVGLVIQQRLLSTLRESIFQKVQVLHLGYHWQHGAGEMITRTTRDADKLRDALTSFWRQGIDSMFVVIAAMAFLFWYHPTLGLVPLVLTAGALWLLLRQADVLVQLDRAVGAAYDAVNQDLSEGVHGVRVIKAFSLEADRVDRFAAQVDRFKQLTESALAYAAKRIPLPQMLVGFGQVWVLGWGVVLVSRGSLNLGELLASLLMVNMLVLRIEGIGRVIKTYADARSSAARIWELLDEPPAITSGDVPPPDGDFGIHLEGVRVLPPGGGHPVLEDVSLSVQPGELVAVVGATGSGKSTLAGLFPRLADPQDGTLLAGRGDCWVDLRSLDLAAFRRRVQVVPQENFLFSDSLADNLRLASPGATDDELREALKWAQADEFVNDFPEGLDTRLGDRGVTLSGGQRQRLCLARALLARPAVLVLDDSTSALDALTERRILDGLRHLNGAGQAAPAVLLISNRRSALERADRVLLLSAGRIVAQGTHADLAGREAAYRELMGLDADGH